MRLIQLTPGTGTFHCGGCLRDHALAVSLRKLGHDATMVPMYLPLVLDEPAEPADNQPVFFGGVNVYLQQQYPIFRKTPAWLDRLFDAPAMLSYAAKKAALTRAEDSGDMAVSMLKGEEGFQHKELDRLVKWIGELPGRKVDAVLLSNTLLVGMAGEIKRRLGVPVLCSLQGEDGFLDSIKMGPRGEAWRLLRIKARDADLFIAPSRFYADAMSQRMELHKDRIRVVPNGLNFDGYEPVKRGENDPPTIGFLARLCRAKGLQTLIEAFFILKKSERFKAVRLRGAGAMVGEDELFLGALRDRLRDHKLDKDVDFVPNPTRSGKIAFLGTLSLMSVPSTFGEAFGLFMTESLAMGVPLVLPRRGAFTEFIESTGGGVLCEPDGPEPLAAALAEALDNPARLREMATRGRDAVLEHYTAEAMARGVAQVCEEAIAAHKNAS